MSQYVLPVLKEDDGIHLIKVVIMAKKLNEVEKWKSKNKYLNMLQARRHNGFVKVITGIRRCGKSYLMNNIFCESLKESGVDDDHIIKFAFDSAEDLQLIGEDLQMLAKSKKKVDPKKFLPTSMKK